MVADTSNPSGQVWPISNTNPEFKLQSQSSAIVEWFKSWNSTLYFMCKWIIWIWSCRRILRVCRCSISRKETLKWTTTTYHSLFLVYIKPINEPIKNKISALLFSGGLVGERTWPLTTWMKKIPNTSIWHWRKLAINITKSITHILKHGVMITSTFSTEVFYIFHLKRLWLLYIPPALILQSLLSHTYLWILYDSHYERWSFP